MSYPKTCRSCRTMIFSNSLYCPKCQPKHDRSFEPIACIPTRSSFQPMRDGAATGFPFPIPRLENTLSPSVEYCFILDPAVKI